VTVALRRWAAGAATAAVLVLVPMPAAARAHVLLRPDRAAAATLVLLTVLLPDESSVPMTGLRLTVPPGLVVDSIADMPGYTAQIVRDQSHRPVALSWQGGRTTADHLALFRFAALTPAHAQTVTLTAVQTFADGSTHVWRSARVTVGGSGGSSGGSGRRDRAPAPPRLACFGGGRARFGRDPALSFLTSVARPRLRCGWCASAMHGAPDLRPRVLVVDDDAATRTLLELILGRSGYLVTSAESGEEAVGLLGAGVPDAIVTDLQLPAMSGLELAVAARARCPGTPAMIVTAARHQAARAAHELGIPVMSKPFAVDDLVARVDRMIALGSERERPPDQAA
jgi:CheY-like chemotaxis protein